MSVVRVSSNTFSKLPVRSQTKTFHSYKHMSQANFQNYTQMSQPSYKVKQQSQNKSNGWVIPAALAVVGLGLSTFSTQKLVSCNTIKMLSSSSTTTNNKQ